MWKWVKNFEDELKKDITQGWDDFEKRLAVVEAKTAEVVAKDVHDALQKAYDELKSDLVLASQEGYKVQQELILWKTKVLQAVENTVHGSVDTPAPSPAPVEITLAPQA